ncbi:MAG: amidohydrolase [Burkholderiales bacterium]|jgi:hippurate hydrolase|nr:amidohydrolase [Burkholderiales bacterium]
MKKPINNPIEGIRRLQKEYVAFRRDLHAHPEIGFELTRTKQKVIEKLIALNIEFHDHIGGGLVAVIHGDNPESRGIGLRADMDALPMQEENNFDHASTIRGRMHGCGHDGHTAMLLACGHYLQETRRFSGTAYLIFQPAEEGGGGAKAMIRDGLFERFSIDRVFALHNWPSLSLGKVAIQTGAVMAACDRIFIDIEGRGGHAAHPHLTIDPVVVAGHIITATQSIVARNQDPFDSAVISICGVEAGNMNAMNVIPRTARMIGTVRTFKPQVQEMIQKRLHEVVTSIAAAFGATATLRYITIDPATINDAAQATFAKKVAARLFGDDNIISDLKPSMGAEDFTYMLQRKPGAYLRIGQLGATSRETFLHNSEYDFNDEVIPYGAGLLAGLVEDIDHE